MKTMESISPVWPRLWLRILVGLAVILTPAFGAEETTELVIAAPAKFETKDAFTRLIIADGARKFSLSWAVQPPGQEGTHYFPVTLQAGETYTFTLRNLPKAFVVADGHEKALMDTMFQRVSSGGNVLYDREVCELHHTKMDWKEVPIIYGLVGRGPAEPSWEVEQKLFPHRREVAYGGCVMGPGKTEKLLVCPDCRAAFERWKKEQGK